MSSRTFRDRRDAGAQLAEKLRHYSGQSDVVVLGLPRGGVPVAYEVARALRAPLDVFVVRKLGVPGHPELAMGAVASGGAVYLNRGIVSELGISREEIERTTADETKEVQRREEHYRQNRKPLELSGRTVIVVDDGLATGASMFAAVKAIAGQGPRAIVIAAPVAASDTVRTLSAHATEVVCVLVPPYFRAVGPWYENFDQTTDEEVTALLAPPRVSGALPKGAVNGFPPLD